MRWPALARKTHKWLALLVAIQAVFWTLSGLYMTAVHIDIIHGDRLVKAPPSVPIDMTGLVEPAHLAHLAPGLLAARLERQLGEPVYVVETESGKALFDARTGAKLSPLTEAQARARARALFAEDGGIVSAELLTKAPLEVQTRPMPLWRVEFEGAWRPTFYISPFTGELVSRRHDLWRTFDFVWMFHIMDYDDRQDVNNPLIRVFTWMAVATAATGGWLLIYSFRRKRRVRKAAA
ncbi:MAG: hypothetical protein EPO51_20170 [Phenylobacterium sp.]|uniref:PepSY domain-containing protein n=1 Tax=Phenylobacterium sp. TaxID=1871053 RepID=UPI001202976A|nr:PepSY domain-containing protein [Phenylobacterium sp.]TAJ69847.1 MAG: hypothetical protein EPO51_20170 [Phenylobacterium sp.]